LKPLIATGIGALSERVIQDPIFYLFIIPAVIIFGVSKGGFSGVGGAAMPIAALTGQPVKAAAIILPLLLVQDAVSVWTFRRTIDKRALLILLPGAAVGIYLAYLLAASVSTDVILAVLGVISVAFGFQRMYADRQHARRAVDAPALKPAAPQVDAALGVAAGVGAGFTSQIAHAGGPPYQMWILPKRLPRDILVGTTSILFASINWMKVPAYVALGQFTPANLWTSAALAPVAMGSTLAGIWLVRRFDAERFYTVIYWLMVVTGAALIWEAYS
jgi:uncharacterized membrane protein YfcA